MAKHNLTRRNFLKISAGGVLGMLMSAVESQVGGASSSTSGARKPGLQTSQETLQEDALVNLSTLNNEAPMLKALVSAGVLPPVEQRLPEAPLMVTEKEIGRYGGEIRMIHKGSTSFLSNYDLTTERILNYSDQDLRTIIPNIIESWQISPDAMTWTFHMRVGMKWSDGSSLTSEDVRFWWIDVINNSELALGMPWQFHFGGTDMSVEILDAYTFKFTFAAPFGNFIAHLTRWYPFSSILLPSTFMKQFHIDYADPVTLAQLIAQYGFQNWVELFTYMIGGSIWSATQNCTEIPVLGPWHIVENPEEGLYLWERNPYYWKVDQVGNQLPYINSLRYDLVSNDAEVKVRLAQGEIDILGQHDVSIVDYPFYQANQSAGNYIIGDYLSCMTDRYVLFPQHYIADDAVLTDIVNHPNFVKALSVAIDREAINQSLFYGLASVGQLSVMPNSQYYKASYGTAWAQYDPTLANQLLDAMGLDNRDGEGFRLRSDGQRLTFTIEHTGERVGLACSTYADMVFSYWRAVGIDASAVLQDEGTYNQRMMNYQVHCGMWHADRCTDMLWHIEPAWFLPTSNPNQGTACSAWAVWYSAEDRTDPNLIEPPAEIKTLYDLFDQMTATTNEVQRVQYGQQILDWLANTPLAIGLILESPAPLLFNKHLDNLPPDKSPIGWDTFGLSTYHPETFYYNYQRVYLPQVSR